MNGSQKSLEERLAAVDFGGQSARRERLRRDLLARLARQDCGKEGVRPARGGVALFRRPLPAFGLGILLAAVSLTLLSPEGRAALAKLPGLLQVGPHTAIVTGEQFSAVQLDSLLAAADARQEKGEWVVQTTPYGNWGSDVPRGGDAFIKEACSLRVAAGLVNYPLLVPTYFNEQIPVRLRFQKAVVMPGGSVRLYFGIGSLETVLQLTPVGESGMITHSESVTISTADGTRALTLVQPELEELQIAGRTVFWQKHSAGVRRNLGGRAVKDTETEIGRFLWEQDGLSCMLNGKFLTKEEGLQIIASLRASGGEH